MTQNEIIQFEKFLLEAFSEDTYARELRLSAGEKEHLERKYPKVSLKRMDNGQCCDGRCWYDVGIS